ncbi:winged helix-turn-helix transcriptional regulator [Natrinema halophilum]|uniref:Helix-turn-helix transcriptional regulator n=1 Tax=Natrinema halophilum TaxID=1699371 RepID=A0A7D5KRQ1_9EURY|nr:helix-turn-helix domain-containing protein [Natrinema halophilum]QLG49557.1 helix-turn-helix transcriptional regulator [Natrinema halophilum]
MSDSGTAKTSERTAAIDRSTLFSLLGKAHTLEILNEVVLGDDQPVRFGDLQETLGLSPNTLSRRLEELVEVGFLERTQYDEIPPRVEYEATQKLEALEPTFRELETWMDRYGSEQLGCPE